MNGPIIRIYEQTDSYTTVNLDHARLAECKNLKGPIDERRVRLIWQDGTKLDLEGMDAERVISALDERTVHPNPRHR